MLPIRTLPELHSVMAWKILRDRETCEAIFFKVPTQNDGRFIRPVTGSEKGHSFKRFPINGKLLLEHCLKLQNTIEPGDLKQEAIQRRITQSGKIKMGGPRRSCQRRLQDLGRRMLIHSRDIPSKCRERSG